MPTLLEPQSTNPEVRLRAQVAALEQRLAALERSSAGASSPSSHQDVVNASSITFSGLDGDSEMEYEIYLVGWMNPGSANTILQLRPNADSGSTYGGGAHRHYRNADGTLSSDLLPWEARDSLGQGLQMGMTDWDTSGGHIIVKSRFQAKKFGTTSPGAHRPFRSEWTFKLGSDTQNEMAGSSQGYWVGTGNVTSLQIAVRNSTFTGRVLLSKPFV